jgi:hypothetical protein
MKVEWGTAGNIGFAQVGLKQYHSTIVILMIFCNLVVIALGDRRRTHNIAFVLLGLENIAHQHL